MASGLLASGNVRYYHPADNFTEFTQNLLWVEGSGGAIQFVPSILISGMKPVISQPEFTFTIVSSEYDNLESVSGFTCAVWMSGFFASGSQQTSIDIGFGNGAFNRNTIIIDKTTTDFRIASRIDGNFNSKDWTPSLQNADWHLFVADIRFETSGWRHRISVDGGDWLDLGIDAETNTPTSDTIARILLTSDVSPKSVFDEMILWGDNDLFTDQELSNLYQLFSSFDTTMDQYGTTFDINAVRDINLFISGKTQTSGNLNLAIKSNGASGMLDPENVVFYHPLNDNVEHTLNETWEGSGIFVAGAIGSGVSAVTPSNLFFGDSSGAFDEPGNASRIAIDILEANKIIITALLPSAGPSQQKAVVANIDGFNITYGPEILIRELNGSIGVITLSPSSVIFASQGDTSKPGLAVVGSISGSTITLGSEFQYTSSDFSISMNLSKIDSTRFVVLHQDDLNSFAATMRIGEVSGTTITYGSELVFNTDTNVFFGRAVASPISESGFLLSYSTLSSGLFSTIVSVSGTTITSLGTPIQVPVSGDETKLLPTLDTIFMDSTRFALTAGFDIDATGSDQGRLIVGSISGTDITFGTDAIFDSVISSATAGLFTQDTMVVALNAETGVIGFKRSGSASVFKNTMNTVIFNTSGTTITNISSRSRIQDLEAQDMGLVSLDNTRVVSIVADENVDPTTVDTRVGELFEFISLSSNNSNYPKPIGNKNIATFFWSKNPTKNRAEVRLERGYNITFTSGSIALGGTTATWNSSGIQSLMDVLNDDGEHSLATYFIHQSGTTWKLLTSVDGESFVDRGVQDVGSQGLLTTNTDAEVFLFDPDDEDQWLDEAVLWAGEPEQFNQFDNLELFKLNRLATILDQPMPSFSSAAFPVSASGSLVMPTTFNVLQASGELFIKGHIPVESSVALVAQGPVPASSSVSLMMQGPAGADIVLVAKGPIPESGNATLLIKGPIPLQSSGTLWAEGIIILNSNMNLVIPLVHDVSQLSGTLFLKAGNSVENNITLMTKGPLATTSPDSGLLLFIDGSSAEVAFDKIVDVFLRTADFNPTVIGLFTPSASGVTIEVWDVINGVNTQLTILDNICFAIGDTGRFGWSTDQLLAINRNTGQFIFRMTDSIGETFVGEFFLTNPGDGLNKHPDDFDDYILIG